MAQAERQSQNEGARLWKSLDALDENSRKHIQQRYGLSEEFQKKALNQDQAMALCDQAMATLAGEYIDHMAAFKDAKDPLETLHHLEEAEAIWAAESTIIIQLDAGGDEEAFLHTIREQAYSVLEQRLITAADACSKNASPENMALCIGILATMDRALASWGHPVDSIQRTQLRELIVQFR
ncbi:MAG: hypothetical protein KDK78_01590 [Chlamydiia bacterium]|nr:hypothetical protein [Chlamydiia bacterium]